eukprot:TRINITY_DN1235_c2_g1_i6.p1 TRINITY_DN1235_c2_g1~~TRINITY_DN1235_c2_g1_i6.p1  ORF type:complete len:415 (-),score=40.75 TRINITY_DN1235_c2_g1_i6:485-1729(-)
MVAGNAQITSDSTTVNSAQQNTQSIEKDQSFFLRLNRPKHTREHARTHPSTSIDVQNSKQLIEDGQSQQEQTSQYNSGELIDQQYEDKSQAKTDRSHLPQSIAEYMSSNQQNKTQTIGDIIDGQSPQNKSFIDQRQDQVYDNPIQQQQRNGITQSHQIEKIRSNDESVHLFVGVLSASANFDRRQAVRETWGRSEQLFKLLFFVSRPRDLQSLQSIRDESVKFNDVVFIPYVQESYQNITYQTLEVVRWGAMWPEVTHVMKADDDTYVRVEKLIQRLQEAPRSWMFMGHLELNEKGGRNANRDPNSQWYISWEEWPEKLYPPWAHGAGYIISKDLAKEIAGGASLLPTSPQLFRFEDVAMGMWVNQVAKDRNINISYVNDNDFGFWTECKSNYVVIHYVKPDKMRSMFARQGRC